MKKVPSKPILIIDDETHILESFEIALEMNGFNNVITCSDPREVAAILDRDEPEMVLLDLNMPHIRGEELLAMIKKRHEDVPVVVVTGVDSPEMAVKCMRLGAHDYLVKPIDEDRLLTTVGNTFKFHSMATENRSLRGKLLDAPPNRPECFADIVTDSALMRAVFRYIEAVAPVASDILITGETGVGKELIARAIHKASGVDGELVTVNVAGVDDVVFADTLFGHEAGAFTGARGRRGGMIEKAEGGTLFLDEIGDLSESSQVKLLRLLQEREYQPLGSDRVRRAAVRVVAATNRDLREARRRGAFRDDLFFRLQTHETRIPPLRERSEDIPVLANHFLQAAARMANKTVPVMPEETLILLRAYSFPGNIRELKSMIIDAVASGGEDAFAPEFFRERIRLEQVNREIAAVDLEPAGERSLFGSVLPALKDVQMLLIDEALRRADGNKSQAAKLLNTSRQALNWHLRKHANADDE